MCVSANQKPLVICTCVTSFTLVLQVCTRVTEELHSFLSQSGLSNFLVFIISGVTINKKIIIAVMTIRFDS